MAGYVVGMADLSGRVAGFIDLRCRDREELMTLVSSLMKRELTHTVVSGANTVRLDLGDSPRYDEDSRDLAWVLDLIRSLPDGTTEILHPKRD